MPMKNAQTVLVGYSLLLGVLFFGAVSQNVFAHSVQLQPAADGYGYGLVQCSGGLLGDSGPNPPTDHLFYQIEAGAYTDPGVAVTVQVANCKEVAANTCSGSTSAHTVCTTNPYTRKKTCQTYSAQSNCTTSGAPTFQCTYVTDTPPLTLAAGVSQSDGRAFVQGNSIYMLKSTGWANMTVHCQDVANEHTNTDPTSCGDGVQYPGGTLGNYECNP
jgi:hypothetical protein